MNPVYCRPCHVQYIEYLLIDWFIHSKPFFFFKTEIKARAHYELVSYATFQQQNNKNEQKKTANIVNMNAKANEKKWKIHNRITINWFGSILSVCMCMWCAYSEFYSEALWPSSILHHIPIHHTYTHFCVYYVCQSTGEKIQRHIKMQLNRITFCSVQFFFLLQFCLCRFWLGPMQNGLLHRAIWVFISGAIY